jgi:hypothetical protein
VRGAVLTVLTVLNLTGVVQVWHIVALVAVYGAASGFFGPAFDSIVPQLVPEEDLSRRTPWTSASGRRRCRWPGPRSAAS